MSLNVCFISFPIRLSLPPPPVVWESISSQPLGGSIDWINARKWRGTLLSFLPQTHTHTYARTKGAQTWTWSIMCQAFLPQWMNGPVTIGYRPSIVYWHWRLSSHAVHYPKRGRLERDPKRPLIIIPFREEKEGGQKNRYCNPVYIE